MVGGGIKQQQAEGENGARRSLRRASLEEAAEAEVSQSGCLGLLRLKSHYNSPPPFQNVRVPISAPVHRSKDEEKARTQGVIM